MMQPSTAPSGTPKPASTSTPLPFPCTHTATAAELERDPTYEACNAASGQPCVWAVRYDGVVNPPFHSERLEAAIDAASFGPVPDQSAAPDPETFREAVLLTGLI